MAKAIIRADDDGGLDVIVPAWQDEIGERGHHTIAHISYNDMADLADMASVGDSNEPDYMELAMGVAERICEILGMPSYVSNHLMRAAAFEAVSPGPGFDEPKQFDV